MKIAHIVYSDVGGAGNIALSLFREGKKSKILKNSIIFTGPVFSRNYSIHNKTSFFFIKTFKNFSFLAWFKIFLRLIKIRPNIVFVHNFMIVPSIIYSLIFSKNIVYVDHSAINYKSYKDKLIAIILRIFFIDLIVLNYKNYQYYKKFKIFDKKIHLIKNGIDELFYKKTYKKKNKKVFSIGMAGRLDYFKKQELIIEAFLNSKLKKLNLSLSFAGDGPELKHLKRKVKFYKIKNKVKFEGLLSEKKLKNWFNNLDLYIHASDGEAMSTSILQAMSMELPIAASNVDGIRNLFREFPKIGKTFVNNSNQIADVIKYFYNKKNYNYKVSRKYIIQKFSSKIMFLNYLKMLEKIT